MRLICPNCSAQYEIDVSLVPDEGRDVQCSNCGHTWFELPPPSDDFSDPTPGAEPEAEPEKASKPETKTTEDAPSHAAMAIAAASEDSEEDDSFFDRPATGATPAAGAASIRRRPADAADVDLLKEEASREMAKRRAPPSEPIEMQTDLGLAEIKSRRTPSRALRARMAHLKEDAPAEDKLADPNRTRLLDPGGRAEVISDAASDTPRRDLLPDIDEINSTLKSTKKRGKADPAAVEQQQKGFRIGFLLMTLLAIAMIIAYAQAPAIVRLVPGSESVLLQYVDGANVARDWIAGLMGTSN